MRADRLPILLLAYGAASLLHHVHNAMFLDEYPSRALLPNKVRMSIDFFRRTLR